MKSETKTTKMSFSFQNELEEFNLRLICLFNANDYGPIKHIDAKILRYIGEQYAVVQPNEQTQLVLYKLDCFSTKNYYTPNKKLSELLNKKYSKDKDVKYKTISVPECFRFICAQLNCTINKFDLVKNLKSSHLCCFIPLDYLDELIQSQHGLPCVRLQFIQNGLYNQKQFFDNYIQKVNEINKKYLEKYFTLKRAIKLANKGIYNEKVPDELRNVLVHLRKSQSLQLKQELPTQTYELHSVELNLPDGRSMSFMLTCKVNYDGLIIKKQNRKSQEMEEKIYKYSLIFNWI